MRGFLGGWGGYDFEDETGVGGGSSQMYCDNRKENFLTDLMFKKILITSTLIMFFLLILFIFLII